MVSFNADDGCLLEACVELKLPVLGFCLSENHGSRLEQRLVRKALEWMADPTNAFYDSEWAAVKKKGHRPRKHRRRRRRPRRHRRKGAGKDGKDGKKDGQKDAGKKDTGKDAGKKDAGKDAGKDGKKDGGKKDGKGDDSELESDSDNSGSSE